MCTFARLCQTYTTLGRNTLHLFQKQTILFINTFICGPAFCNGKAASIKCKRVQSQNTSIHAYCIFFPPWNIYNTRLKVQALLMTTQENTYPTFRTRRQQAVKCKWRHLLYVISPNYQLFIGNIIYGMKHIVLEYKLLAGFYDIVISTLSSLLAVLEDSNIDK